MTTEQQPPSKPSQLWLLPLGCGCLGLFVGIILFGIGGITSLFMGLVKSTGPHQTYQIAAERLKTDPAAIAALGEPISLRWISRTMSQENETSGTTCIRFGATGLELAARLTLRQRRKQEFGIITNLH